MLKYTKMFFLLCAFNVMHAKTETHYVKTKENGVSIMVSIPDKSRWSNPGYYVSLGSAIAAFLQGMQANDKKNGNGSFTGAIISGCVSVVSLLISEMSHSSDKDQLIKAGLQEFNDADINALRKKEEELRKVLEERQKQQKNFAPKK